VAMPGGYTTAADWGSPSAGGGATRRLGASVGAFVGDQVEQMGVTDLRANCDS
jgi:hypothetical protein